MRQSGFTLLEVIISITILAFLSIFTAQSIQTALKNKSKIQKNTDRFSEVRSALDVMERDINYAFNYRDINIELYNEAGKQMEEARLKKEEEARKKNETAKKPDEKNTEDVENKNPLDVGNPLDVANPLAGTKEDEKKFKPRKEVIVTHFIGEENKLNFSTLSHVRTAKDSKRSDQMEVGYFLKNCKNRINPKKSSNCLWRRTSHFIDDDVTKGGRETVLIENVEKFNLRYLGPNKEEEWLKNWKTDQNGDATTKGNFPFAVEITLSVKNPKRKKPFTMTSFAAIRNPNNPLPKTADDKDKEQTAPTGINNSNQGSGN